MLFTQHNYIIIEHYLVFGVIYHDSNFNICYFIHNYLTLLLA